VREQLEIVLVSPSAPALAPALGSREEFAGMKIVEHPVDDLAPARAAGVHGASAEYVFIGETHSYPHPRMCETLMQHFGSRWAAVMPAMDNGNPQMSTSWAAFLSDYGRWAEGLPVGVTASVPIYNAAFRRDALLELGGRLANAFGLSDDLVKSFRVGNHQVYFEPAALLDHLNVAPYGHWVIQRFAVGMMVGRIRSMDWSLARRLGYVIGSPLIPVVLWRRILPGVRGSFRLQRWPLSTFFWITLGLAIKSCGELLAYAGVPADRSVRRNHEYEMNKLAYSGLEQS
jgi:hypothetical protein